MKSIDGFSWVSMTKELEVEGFVSFHYFEYPKDFNFSGEKHDFWEFLYVDKGEVFVSRNHGPSILLTQGQIIFHKPNEFHTVKCNGEISPSLVVIAFVSRSKCLDFLGSRLITISNHARFLLSIIMEETKNMFKTNLADPFFKELVFNDEQSFGAQTLVRNYFECFLLELISHNLTERHIPQAMAKTTELETIRERFLRAREYMLENISGNLTLDQICRECNICKANLQTVFKKETGMSIIEYYNSLKIQKARKCIREGHGTITTIAYSLGYNSVHYFSRQFKQFAKMSPVEYSRSIKSVLAGKGTQYKK